MQSFVMLYGQNLAHKPIIKDFFNAYGHFEFFLFVLYFSQSREQRVTGILVFLLTGLSVFMAPILKVALRLLPSSMKTWITVRLF